MRATTLALLLAAAVVTATGCGDKVAEKKTPIELKDIPPDIMKVAKEKLPDVAFDTAWRKESGSFEIRGKAKNGKVREIDIKPDGTVKEIE